MSNLSSGDPRIDWQSSQVPETKKSILSWSVLPEWFVNAKDAVIWSVMIALAALNPVSEAQAQEPTKISWPQKAWSWEQLAALQQEPRIPWLYSLKTDFSRLPLELQPILAPVRDTYIWALERWDLKPWVILWFTVLDGENAHKFTLSDGWLAKQVSFKDLTWQDKVTPPNYFQVLKVVFSDDLSWRRDVNWNPINKEKLEQELKLQQATYQRYGTFIKRTQDQIAEWKLHPDTLVRFVDYFNQILSRVRPEYQRLPVYQKVLIAASALAVYNSTTDEELKKKMSPDLMNQISEILLYTMWPQTYWKVVKTEIAAVHEWVKSDWWYNYMIPATTLFWQSWFQFFSWMQWVVWVWTSRILSKDRMVSAWELEISKAEWEQIRAEWVKLDELLKLKERSISLDGEMIRVIAEYVTLVNERKAPSLIAKKMEEIQAKFAEYQENANKIVNFDYSGIKWREASKIYANWIEMWRKKVEEAKVYKGPQVSMK